MVQQYFNQKMKSVFVDRCNAYGIETFEKYLSYRYRDCCYHYSAYAIIGLRDDDYLVRGSICVPSSNYRNGGYFHGWVEFKYREKEYVFDSMNTDIVSKDEWYKFYKPNVRVKHLKKEIIESFQLEKLSEDLYEIKDSRITDNNTDGIYLCGKLFMEKNNITKFIAYDEPSG